MCQVLYEFRVLSVNSLSHLRKLPVYPLSNNYQVNPLRSRILITSDMNHSQAIAVQIDSRHNS